MTARDTQFITFGGGYSRYRRAARRLARQAHCSGVFRSVDAITDEDLRRDHDSFLTNNAALLHREVRGFGYWLWKPYLIYEALCSSSAGYVCFLDAGCVLNLTSARARERFDEYHDMADADGLALAQQSYEEQAWCKADTMDRIGVNEIQRSSGQFWAGMLIVRNTSSNRDLIGLWLDLCNEDDHHYLDDSPSERPNASVFQEHRHDQSILSCLCKTAGVSGFPDETDFSSSWSTLGADFPVWAARR